MNHNLNILKVKNLSIAFKQANMWQNAIFNVSFEINEGDVLGIVGESGSGKSITALSIMQLLPNNIAKINNGSIIFNNKISEIELTKLNNKQLEKIRGNDIAMIFQEPMTSLNPSIKCGKQITEVIMLHKKCSYIEAKKQTLQLFKDVKLPDIQKAFKSYPHQLSGGQKQRVMIAMALSCNPKALIADEPTTALDVTVQNDIILLLKELKMKYGMTIIFISHDLGVIAQIANKILVMQSGKIVEWGHAEQILYNPSHIYTKALIACRPPIDFRPEVLHTIERFYDNTNIISDKIILKEERAANHNKIYSAEPLIKIKNLSVSYPIPTPVFSKNKYFNAVDNISFNVYKGETLGLVGESGCGKTTLGRALLQLIKTKSGNIFYNNVDITQLSQKALRQMRKKIQIIFQDPYSSLNPHIIIGKAIIEPMTVHKIYGSYKQKYDRAIELMESVNLKADFFNRYPHQFSGGQRQRICIARALALNPEFIICDESVSALDVSVQAQTLNLLNKLKKEFKLTYIFISHDLSVVKYMSDRILVMKSGEIIELNEADELYKNPKNEYTKFLIEAIPKIE